MTPSNTIRTLALTAFAVALAAASAAASAAGPDPNADIWQRAAGHAGVPVKVIHGIALTESGRIWADGMKRPWPWTLNSPRGSMFFATRPGAEAALDALLKEGVSNIDIGYMQVNCGYHCARVAKPSDLLDPVTNLMVAAQILKEVRAQVKGDVASSVGAYHAGLRPDRAPRALWYREAVASNIRRLPQPAVKGS